MNNIMDWKWLVGIGAGLWLAVKMGIFGTVEGVTNPVETTVPNNSAAAATTRALMLEAVVRDTGNVSPLLSIDEWNWYFAMIRGTPGPAWEDTNMSLPRDYKMSIDQWAGLVMSAPMFQGGVGKLVGMGGLSNESLQRQFVRSGGGSTELERKLIN